MKKKKIVIAVLALALAAAIFLIVWGNKALVCTTYILQDESLPMAADGFRIAQISDLHNTEFGKNNKRLLSLLKAAEPDIIVITGDMIDSYVDMRDSRRKEISLNFAEEAVKIAPCYYVAGNHEARIESYGEFKKALEERGVNVLENERETLTLGRGTGMLDPVKPMIENIFNGTKLYADISLGAGQPYGAVLTSLGQMYGADCCYDRTGRFHFVRRPDYNDPTAYKHRGYAWEFSENDVNILEGAQRLTTFKAVNTVTVSTDNTEGAICSVTVRNTNPLSPVSTRNIGEQLADEATVYISVGDTTRGSAEDKCREYGTYLLLQNTKQACSISFSTALIPHLDVDDLIRYKGEDMLITQISADLDTKIMTIAAVNVAELPEIEVRR
jgi:hypothetical protein